MNRVIVFRVIITVILGVIPTLAVMLAAPDKPWAFACVAVGIWYWIVVMAGAEWEKHETEARRQ